MKKEAYIRAKRLIKKAFLINWSIPKGYGTRSSDYQRYYDMKFELISKAIALIKKNKLCIKYGIERTTTEWQGMMLPDYITYFEFEGKQFSFHGNYGTSKEFNGKWTGISNSVEACLHKRREVSKERKNEIKYWYQKDKMGYSTVGWREANRDIRIIELHKLTSFRYSSS